MLTAVRHLVRTAGLCVTLSVVATAAASTPVFGPHRTQLGDYGECIARAHPPAFTEATLLGGEQLWAWSAPGARCRHPLSWFPFR